MAQLSTTVKVVTVFPDRARVTRSGKAVLEAGLHALEVSGLPLALSPESLRAGARGTARSRLLGVQLQRAFYAEAPVEQVRQLEQQIESTQDEMRALEAQAELAKQNKASLAGVAGHTETFAMALAAGEMSVEAQLALFDGLSARAAKLDAELQVIASQRRDLERQLQKLQNELNRWRSVPKRQQYTAVVEVEVFQAGDLSVELTYVVSGAGWQPLYDLRLLEDTGTDDKPALEVGYLAQVTQRTGEAWDSVSLTLSTARPALAGILPELDPWYIAPLPPPQAPRFARVAMAPMAMQAAAPEPEMATQGAFPEEAAAEVAVARVESSGAAVIYQIPGTATIPADGAPHKVTIANYDLEPKLDYVAAPKLAEAVYRRAKAANQSPYTLLPGAANLFAGEDFIGGTRLELTPPQGELELYFGVDDRVKVERELKRREVDKRLIGGKRRLVFGYEARLENLLPTEARVTLKDQLPVARHEEIKVRLEAADPKPTEQTELNLLKWELTLAPKEKKTVRFDFSVEHPQGMEVGGLL